jgi:hypothetical protein
MTTQTVFCSAEELFETSGSDEIWKLETTGYVRTRSLYDYSYMIVSNIYFMTKNEAEKMEEEFKNTPYVIDTKNSLLTKPKI